MGPCPSQGFIFANQTALVSVILTKAYVADDKVSDVERHNEYEHKENHVEIHPPVEIPGTVTKGKKTCSDSFFRNMSHAVLYKIVLPTM